VLALIGTFLLLIIAPQQFGTFTGFIIVLLGTAASFAATVSSLEKTKSEVRDTSEKLDVVQKQTNGTLSKLIAMNANKEIIIQHKDRRIADLEAALLKQVEKEENND
jgi:hypothetical protein